MGLFSRWSSEQSFADELTRGLQESCHVVDGVIEDPVLEALQVMAGSSTCKSVRLYETAKKAQLRAEARGARAPLWALDIIAGAEASLTRFARSVKETSLRLDS